MPYLLVFLTCVLSTILGGCTPSARPPAPADELSVPQTGIFGRITDRHSQPMPGAYVYAYRNRNSNLRGPADFEAQTDTTGTYLLDVIEGEYFLVARLRKKGGDAGPPRPGDAWAIPAENPVKVHHNHASRVDFQLQTLMQPMIMREGTLTSGSTGFTGRVVNEAGEPATGAFVLAYRDSDFHRMPDFTSLPADSKGEFTLYLPEGGSYCLAARIKTRGQPVSGEPYGVLQTEHGACLQVENGQIRQIEAIVLKPYQR